MKNPKTPAASAPLTIPRDSAKTTSAPHAPTDAVMNMRVGRVGACRVTSTAPRTAPTPTAMTRRE